MRTENWSVRNKQRKRRYAPWRVTSGCCSRARLFTGRNYELPNYTLCLTCLFYRRDESVADREIKIEYYIICKGGINHKHF